MTCTCLDQTGEVPHLLSCPEFDRPRPAERQPAPGVYGPGQSGSAPRPATTANQDLWKPRQAFGSATPPAPSSPRATEAGGKAWTAEYVRQLQDALEDAVAVAVACKAMVNEQGNRFFADERPNWRKAALAVADEIDTKPDEWLSLTRGEPSNGR